MVYFENEASFQGDFDMEDVADKVTSHILKKEGCPYESEINILLTDALKIKELNKEFRGIDKETDVLSFPNAEFTVPGDFTFLKGEFAKSSFFDPENDCLILGDMVICAEKMVSQAKEFGHGIRREFAFLVAHSTLHFIGYDHMKEQDAAIMENKQKQYLEELGIGR